MHRWNDIVLGLIPTIRARFTDSRWDHTLGVVETAAAIALRSPHTNCPVDSVVTAALMHDLAKDFSGHDLVARIREHQIPVDDVDFGFPAILHGPVAAWMAEQLYGVTDSLALEAISHHTVGKTNPGPVLTVLMVADMTEPGRDYPGIERLRRLAFDDPSSALVACVEHKLQHILRKGRTPHPRATAMLESIRSRAVSA
jgi:predicted HD superfamily hydrolase involved in NAD metabolism